MFRPATHLWISLFLLLGAIVGGFVFTTLVGPESAKLWQLAIFYVLFFLGVFGAGTIAGYALRVVLWRNGLRLEFLRSARRQAGFLGFLGVIALILQSGGLLNLKTGVLLLAIFILIELYAQ